MQNKEPNCILSSNWHQTEHIVMWVILKKLTLLRESTEKCFLGKTRAALFSQWPHFLQIKYCLQFHNPSRIKREAIYKSFLYSICSSCTCQKHNKLAPWRSNRFSLQLIFLGKNVSGKRNETQYKTPNVQFSTLGCDHKKKHKSYAYFKIN